MAYLLRKCYCLPYYFNRLQNESAPVCSSQQLPCIVNISSDLKYYRPPIGFTSFLRSDSLQPLSCSHCSPTCNEVTYEVDMDSTMDLHYSNGRQKAFDGFIDIYYRKPGAVQYTRDVTYDFFKILANIGGIGGLFLGGSILSITEIIYWFTKAGLAFFWPNNKLEQKSSSSKQPFSKHQMLY
uniref:Sodium channel protein Nach n=1 Tax=Lygus hesperus TaxID=30085 RepID=A0A0A9YNW0_LYGHE